jgi:AcrR family transcriptional regulator
LSVDIEERVPAPRGRHAPPPEVRLPLQRVRLVRAAAVVFSERGYANTSSEAISRQAGMSKATFYQHFDNKDEALLAVFDRAAEILQEAIGAAVDDMGDRPAVDRIRAGARAYLGLLRESPEYFKTILVESLAAGAKAAERRDRILDRFAGVVDHRNAEAAARGQIGRFASPHDSYAIVGAIAELIGRQVRLGVPEDPFELAPVIERLILGVAPTVD